MSQFNPRSLNQQGLAHFLAPLSVVLAVGIVGTYMLVSSHADTPGGGVTAGSSSIVGKMVRELAGELFGEKIASELGLPSGGYRNYSFIVQGAGSRAQGGDKYADALGLNLTTNPLQGVKIQLSSHDRSKTSGCGRNGLTHRFRDSAATTNNNGAANFYSCSSASFKLLLKNIPGQYTLPDQAGRRQQLNLGDTRYMQIKKVAINSDGNENYQVYIVITLQQRLTSYPEQTRTKFASAATYYWQRRHPTVSERKLGIIDLKQAQCNPSQVSFAYKNTGFPARDGLAKAAQFGAKKSPGSPLCRVTWNSSPSAFESNNNTLHACVTFVHQYGHLIGYYHSRNPSDIMYITPAYTNSATQQATGC